MFVDQAVITVKAGDGGAGHTAFRRQKYEPKGGPSGGDGGRGGDVLLRADTGLNTLLDFQGRPIWEAQAGEPGSKKQQHGSDGQHLVVRVPPGTIVIDHETGTQLADIGPDGEFVVARGGYGGFGNEHYKSSTNQTPTYAHPGQKGEARVIRLELKLLADVGLLGLPNAGKSTLLAALTKAQPKIGAYPFTTLSPQLGVGELDPSRRLVIADIPGLIEGASQGKGLGHDFLRHIERTKVLVHLLDVSPIDGSDPAKNYRTIRKELRRYSRVLAEREEVICLNKMDLLTSDPERAEAVAKLRKALKLQPRVKVLALSGATHQGTRSLLEELWRVVKKKVQAWAAEKPQPAPSIGPLSDAIGFDAPAPTKAKPKPKPKINAKPKAARKAPAKKPARRASTTGKAKARAR